MLLPILFRFTCIVDLRDTDTTCFRSSELSPASGALSARCAAAAIASFSPSPRRQQSWRAASELSSPPRELCECLESFAHTPESTTGTHRTSYDGPSVENAADFCSALDLCRASRCAPTLPGFVNSASVLEMAVAPTAEVSSNSAASLPLPLPSRRSHLCCCPLPTSSQELVANAAQIAACLVNMPMLAGPEFSTNFSNSTVATAAEVSPAAPAHALLLAAQTNSAALVRQMIPPCRSRTSSFDASSLDLFLPLVGFPPTAPAYACPILFPLSRAPPCTSLPVQSFFFIVMTVLAVASASYAWHHTPQIEGPIDVCVSLPSLSIAVYVAPVLRCFPLHPRSLGALTVLGNDGRCRWDAVHIGARRPQAHRL